MSVDLTIEHAERDRDPRVGLPQRARDAGRHRGERHLGVDDQPHPRPRPRRLRGGEEHERARLLAQVLVDRVAREPHDLVGDLRRRGRRLDAEAAADRVGAAGQLLRECLVHDRDHSRRHRVAIVEVAARQDRDVHRVEVAGADPVDVRSDVRRRALEPDPVAGRAAAHGDDGGVGRGADAGNGADAREQVALQCRAVAPSARRAGGSRCWSRARPRA